MGLSIHNVLKNEYSDSLRRKIPIEDVHYEYDLDVLFGNEMPKVIIRSSKSAKEQTRDINAEIDDELINKMKKFMAYVKNKPMKRKEEEKNQEFKTTATNEKTQPNSIKNNTNLISIADEMNEDDEF